MTTTNRQFWRDLSSDRPEYIDYFKQQVAEFEKAHYKVNIPFEAFFHSVDEKRRETGIAQNQSAPEFAQFCRQEFPDFYEACLSGRWAGWRFENLSGFRGLFLIENSVRHRGKTAYTGTHYRRDVGTTWESVEHLQDLAYNDDTLTPAQRANIDDILKLRGKVVHAPVPEKQVLGEDIKKAAVRATLMKIISDKPVAATKMLNQLLGDMGYDDKFKRDDVMKMFTEFIK